MWMIHLVQLVLHLSQKHRKDLTAHCCNLTIGIEVLVCHAIKARFVCLLGFYLIHDLIGLLLIYLAHFCEWRAI